MDCLDPTEIVVKRSDHYIGVGITVLKPARLILTLIPSIDDEIMDN